jgi:hypothetical protein
MDRLKLPGSLDFEEGEVGGFGLGEFVFDDSVDTAAARAFVEFGAKVGEGVGVACGEHFDFAAVGVADPASQAEFSGLAMHEPAKADALHTTADKKVEDHVEFLVSQTHGELSNKSGYAMKAERGRKDNFAQEIRVLFIIGPNGRMSHPTDIKPRNRHGSA